MDASDTCLERAPGLPTLPASLREPAFAWPSYVYGSCDQCAGPLEGTFTAFTGQEGNSVGLQRASASSQPPHSLPIASLSSSGHPCQEAESRTNDDRTEHQALLQRGCLRVGPQPPDSGRFPDNFTGSVWAWGSGMQEWSCALCCALSLAALCSKYVISPNLQMRVLEARKDYELTFQVKRGDSESVHLPMRHG